jgi:hypothetical protein
MAATNTNNHRFTSRWARAIPAATVTAKGLLAGTALVGILTAGTSAAAARTGPPARSASPAGSAGELAYLVRLARNAEPASAARFRLIEEIDRLVWASEPGVR